jgi:hypothetical protein
MPDTQQPDFMTRVADHRVDDSVIRFLAAGIRKTRDIIKMLEELYGEPEAEARRRIARLKDEKLIAEGLPGLWVPVRPNRRRALTGAEIIADLKRRLRLFQDKGWPHPERFLMHAVVDHGRQYVGISRPKGYRKRKDKQCFWNAADLALTDRGTYVEGYANLPAGGGPMHHAWVTLDGVHAIDPTWRDPTNCHYVGIAFPKEIVARYGISEGYFVPLLSDYEPSAALRELLAAAASDAA